MDYFCKDIDKEVSKLNNICDLVDVSKESPICYCYLCCYLDKI